uniref:Odorant receptor n=1 Tax=Heliconius melpomene rosina TaxID=171916 RepID=A0A1S5XXK8_HELME|nr:olfactory receptor 6 [Heliconius melpomene rosina]
MGDEYYLQPPLNQMFYRVIANMMSISTVGNRTNWGYKTYPKIYVFINIVAIIFAPAVMVSEIAYLCVNFTKLDFEILIIAFSIFPCIVLGNIDIFSSKTETYIRLSRSLLSKIHIYNIYKYNKNEFMKKKLIFVEKSIRISSYYLVCFYTSNWVSWILMPIYNNYKNKEAVLNHTVQLETCVYLWLPYDYRYDFNVWIFVHTINTYIIFAGAYAIMIYQIIFYILTYNLIGHIEIFKNKLKTEFNEDLTDEQVHFRLVEIIKYHNFTWQVFEDLQTTFGLNVAANYLENLVGNGLLLFQLKYGGKDKLLQYIAMGMTYTGGPIIMSIVIEDLRRRTLNLSELLYAIPWENMSIPNQKIVLLVLQKMQIVMDFKAFGGISAGVAPMISILKTTFSYYVMLKSTRE